MFWNTPEYVGALDTRRCFAYLEYLVRLSLNLVAILFFSFENEFIQNGSVRVTPGDVLSTLGNHGQNELKFVEYLSFYYQE